MQMSDIREVRKGHKSTLTLVAHQRQPGTETVWSRLLQGQARVFSHDKPAMSRNRASRLARGSQDWLCSSLDFYSLISPSSAANDVMSLYLLSRAVWQGYCRQSIACPILDWL